MNTKIKYALFAGAGYVLHSVLNRPKEERKTYKPTPLKEDTLASKLVTTVSEHLVEKLFDYKPRSRYNVTYGNFTSKGDK
ncbi:hypothetical protein PP914_gp086 [Arthrobacter phage Qui]|jgi:hypothetical protein|uniref:Uncharacterized protein n=1 Tax=Arthrobacter phage Qui TaxID=2603260 RepID=A0A5B8WK33_9CAUD|nr:hypothetical protein PP914_gp086 [Arthrobacter phage Qui]QED11576.1 hypothetical protein SEA_QUI_86 [Arthrobacter phage Qui]QOC56408.1 hypothetical protein SEA_PAELLA_86 [Arthrobacter phage Paella]